MVSQNQKQLEIPHSLLKYLISLGNYNEMHCLACFTRGMISIQIVLLLYRSSALPFTTKLTVQQSEKGNLNGPIKYGIRRIERSSNLILSGLQRHYMDRSDSMVSEFKYLSSSEDSVSEVSLPSANSSSGIDLSVCRHWVIDTLLVSLLSNGTQ